ncbi:hypothetical protein B0H14DRAFT_2640316 [Mycena olivaceomarginata]|nr:hypothetical protein B0H14DRAFT_2640316 [Mycena olivaceomarginata]
MARPKKRTQQLRQIAKNATKSRQPIKYDIPSDLDPAPGPGTDASIEEPLVSHEEHSPHCSHDHHSPDPDPDNRTWDFDLGDELPDLDCDSDDEREEMDDQVVAAPEISEERSRTNQGASTGNKSAEKVQRKFQKDKIPPAQVWKRNGGQGVPQRLRFHESKG